MAFRNAGRIADAPGAGDDERVLGLTTAALLALVGNEPANAYRSASRAVDAARAADVGGALALGLSVRAQARAVSGLSTSEQVDADVASLIASRVSYRRDRAGHPPKSGGKHQGLLEPSSVSRVVLGNPAVSSILSYYVQLHGLLIHTKSELLLRIDPLPQDKG